MPINHVKKMTIAAHRGDCYNYYENTMTAFEAALESGADMIEFDVHLTKDDVLIIMHDHTVDRTTDGSGNIADKTRNEMLALNAGDPLHPEKVPTFDAFMQWAAEKGTMLNIEIKEYYSPESEQRCIRCIEDVIAAVEKYNLRDKAVLNSFDAWVLEYIYKHYGTKYMLHGFYPFSAMMNVSIDPAEYLYCACICGRHDKEKFDFLLEKGIEPWVGASVTQADKFALCLEYGAKLATVNNPAEAIQKLKALGAR